ncbi:MAG: GAF domain-containing protein [Pseudomonadota bacterium]|nr:GAF domain-containing protein [Pseudomonadota bacterium]
MTNEHYSTMRDGLNITNCDSEPVRTPGCVQAHGALLVLRLADLCILQASENVEAVLGYTVEALLQQPVGLVIGPDGATRLLAMLAENESDCNPLYLLSLPPLDGAGALDVTVHTIDGVVILECEATGRLAPVSADAYGVVKKTVARLQAANSLLQLCALAASEIRQLTGMDRVMVYKFHEDGHGEVFAESLQPGLASWVGLHYPAEDIPKPARDLFRKTWVRPIPDMTDALAEMVPLANPDTGLALDMTYCYLRGVSKMCTEFYRNMGVAATLTLSIRRGDQLWGLLSCTYSAAPRYLSYQVRAACEFLAQVVSVQHSAAEDRETAHYRHFLDRVHLQWLTTVARKAGIAALADSTPSLLDGMSAGGAALFLDNRWYRTGVTPDANQLQVLGQWLTSGSPLSPKLPLYATDCLMRDYPAAADFAASASGLMALRLSSNGPGLIMWFRPETMQSIHWAGNPHEKLMVFGPNGPRLTPRRSFDTFVESVRNRSLPWTSIERETMDNFRLQLMQAVALRAEADRSADELDTFRYVARHDLKEPLRVIRRYASGLTANAGTLDVDERGMLDGVTRLTTRMEGLLDSLLHFSGVGNADVQRESVDLGELVAEAVAMVAVPENISLDLVIAHPLPVVQCYRLWTREIYVHLLSNALLYNRGATRRVELGVIAANDPHPRPGCPPGQRHQAIQYVRDDGIGIAAASFGQVFKLFKRLHGRDDYGGGAGTGLTVVQKLVARHGGEVWVDSGADGGATFYFTLPDSPTH